MVWGFYNFVKGAFAAKKTTLPQRTQSRHNSTPIQSFPVKYRFAFHRVNFPTGQAEKNS